MTQSLTYVELDIPAFAARQGFAANRARWLTSSAASPTALMSRSGHRAWVDISELYIYVQNSRLSPVNINNDFQGEVGLGTAATVTASIEYPAGTFTQVKFSGSASTSVADKQIKKSDLITLATTIPAGAIFWVRIYYSNASGVIYNAWQDSATYGDAVHKTSATDQTMSGTVVDDSGWSMPPAAIIAASTLASIGIVGDSIGYGNCGPTGSEAAPYIADTGVIAGSIADEVPLQNLSACGARAYASSDRYWPGAPPPANVVALLPFDGAQNSTTMIDVVNGHSFTAHGDAKLDNAHPVFGATSLKLAGAGNITADGSADFAFGTGDFQIDGWVYLSANAPNQAIYEGRPAGVDGAYPILYLDSGNTLNYFVNNAIRISGGTLSLGVQYHWAITRVAGNTRLFLDGVQRGSTYVDATNYLSGGANRPIIGTDANGGAGLNGWMDEIRVMKGAALWSSNFTRPSSPTTPPSGQPRHELVQYCTQIICQLGINDLWGAGSGGTRTATQLQADLAALWAVLRSSYGFLGSILQVTLAPHTSSTDGWLTTANQTVSSETPERLIFNGAVRLTLPGTIDFYDVANVLETAAGLWIVSGGLNWMHNAATFGGWFVNLASLTSGQADADGGTSAYKLTENNASGVHYTSDNVLTAPAGTYTMQVKAKQSGRRLEFRLSDGGGSNFAYVVFDLSGGQIGTQGVGGSGFTVSSRSITALPNSWFLCVVTFSAGAAVGAAFFVLDNGTGTGALSQSYTGNNTSGVFLYHPQLEHGSTANTYTASNPIALTDDGLHPNNSGFQFIVDSGQIAVVFDAAFRFAIDTDYLPNTIDCIPSIKSLKITPAIIGLGSDLGQRASVTVTFKDHRHVFDTESFDSGTFWGKWRARYGLKLRGHEMRVIRGAVGQSLGEMEQRRFVIESSNGPNASGEYSIIAKDVLKFADGDRAQCPVLSNGFLQAAITNSATSATLSPSGIGNSEYPASGYVALGGNEVAAFTRTADALTLTRAQFNTVGAAHDAGDRVQLCKYYNGQDVAVILQDLLTTFADVPDGYIPLTDWQAETLNYLGVVFTALLTEPTSVNTLASELIEQAGLAVWWDDINQIIKLQVLRAVVGVSTIDMETLVQDSLTITEQADKRLSQVYVYFGKIDPTKKQDQIENYRSTSLRQDTQAEIDYGSAAIKKIYSRWIPAGGRTTADLIANKHLGRFRDPPRNFKFDLMRYAQSDPQLGAGYFLESWQLQEIDGTDTTVPIQVSSLNPGPDRFEVEAEEMLWTPFGGDIDPNTRTIIFDASENDINLRTRHDQLYPVPVAGKTINFIINESVIIGSSSTSSPAIDVGTWPGGVTVNLTVIGRIQGHGGQGGQGGFATYGAGFSAGNPGLAGGTALFTRQAIGLNSANGEIWGGGGGGGGGGSFTDFSSFATGGGGGGGGTGTLGGLPGAGGFGSNISGTAGSSGGSEAGGAGGTQVAIGGTGGGPGLAGSTGTAGASAGGGAGGAAGAAIDGVSFTTAIGGAGDIRGGQVN